MPIPDLDFARIRPYGQPASRSAGFEELASVLIRNGIVDWPDDTRFSRFGNPDGGREGKGTLPTGQVWAWQAKYLFEFNASAASQVHSSVKRTLENEPTLARYFVVMPYDLPAGDTATLHSAHTRWTNKVSEWKEIALSKGLEVKFEFVGAHELVTVLTEPRNEGRARYWFGADLLTREWQNQRLNKVIAKVGPRYTPTLHVEVPAVRALEAVGRTDEYIRCWQDLLAELRDALHQNWHAPEDVVAFFEGVLPRAVAALEATDIALMTTIDAARTTAAIPQIGHSLAEAIAAVRAVDQQLHRHCLTNNRYFIGEAGSLYSQSSNALRALLEAEDLSQGSATHAASKKQLLITGRAGVGKTHLLCDVAKKRLSEGRPTLLLLGQDFYGGSISGHIGQLTQLGSSAEDVIALLDAASEAAGCVGLLMIDGLNESERAEQWGDDLRELTAVLERFPNVGLVLSCRSEFVDSVLAGTNIPRVEHTGFGERTDEAIRRFTQEYELELPIFPVLNPEFRNPLFLKLTCEALQTLGMNRFQFGAAGISTVIRAYLEAINKRLARPPRCDYDERSDLVQRVASELAKLDTGVFERDVVKQITERVLPDRTWSRSLMKGLLSEGVLLEVSGGQIAFGYQRLGDFMRAIEISAQGLDVVRQWVSEVGVVRWTERGVLGALAVIVPEQLGVEVFELVDPSDGDDMEAIAESFLESLLLRSSNGVTERAVRAVAMLLSEHVCDSELWERLVQIACIPDHPLNAKWLHAHLKALELPERDASWSTWLVGTVDSDEESPVKRIIEWAWPLDMQDQRLMSDEVVVLVTQVLGWMLTTSDRRVRDRASKAIVSIAERTPAAFSQALALFAGTNDPYVIERLTAAACGVALRTDDVDAVCNMANGVEALLGGRWPEHLLTRDYVRRIYQVALDRGWTGTDRRPPYGAKWPIPTRTLEKIEALSDLPEGGYGSIWYSLTSSGDFGRYIVRTALQHVVTDDNQVLLHTAERAMFDRVLELGWTPELFYEIDLGRLGGWDGKVERIGKKYQWIAFYEILGRIADNYSISPSWGSGELHPYEYAEQLVWRDIDPTILVRQPVRRNQHHLWFVPDTPTFPETVTEEYPNDMSGVPDPLSLICLSDSDETQWLAVVSKQTWKQPLPPEIVALKVPRLQMWIDVEAYLVPVAQTDSLETWARDRDWSEEPVPEIHDVYNVLLRSYPSDPAWITATTDGDLWKLGDGDSLPASLLQVAVRYGGTGTSLDGSAKEETTGYLPSKTLIEALGLSKDRDFVWNDLSGIAVCDPSIRYGGENSLLIRRDLVTRLAESEQTFFWKVQVGVHLNRHDSLSHPDRESYRWVGASASYILNGDRVQRIHALASRFAPGPMVESKIQWDTDAAVE